MNKQYLQEKIINRMLDNLYFSSKPGTIIASPSTNPPYQYHWIRDAALSMRVFINLYSKTKKDIYLIHILNYIEREYEIQKMKTLTGIGEPKVNIDSTPYNKPWGRPQNDGPALRCINLILFGSSNPSSHSFIFFLLVFSYLSIMDFDLLLKSSDCVDARKGTSSSSVNFLVDKIHDMFFVYFSSFIDFTLNE